MLVAILHLGNIEFLENKGSESGCSVTGRCVVENMGRVNSLVESLSCPKMNAILLVTLTRNMRNCYCNVVILFTIKIIFTT